MAAEVYFKNLVAELESRRAEERAKNRGVGGGVRLVTEDEGLVRPGEGSGRAEEGRGDRSPVLRRAQTPTAGRSEAWGFAGLRARASSGD